MAQPIPLYHTKHFRYLSHNKETKGIGFSVYARTREFADKLVERINKALDYNLKPKRFGFCKTFYTDTPPYELEQAQLEGVEEIERRVKENEQKKLHTNNQQVQ